MSLLPGKVSSVLGPMERFRMMMQSPLVGDMTRYWLQGGRWNNLHSDFGLNYYPDELRSRMFMPRDSQEVLKEMGMPGWYSNMPRIEQQKAPYMPMREWGPYIVGKPKRKV